LDTPEAKAESVHLAYSLSSSGKNSDISLKEKLLHVLGENSNLHMQATNLEKDKSILENNLYEVEAKSDSINLSFILGFFLGDGTLYVRIRDNQRGLNFVPKFEIKQKYTEVNVNLMELICKFLQSKKVKANLKTNSQYVFCLVEGVDNVCCSLIPLLNTHKELFFWKTFQLKMTEQFGKLVALDVRNLRQINYLTIKTLYSIDNNRDLPMEH
jgi:hypothetical protein